MGSNVQPRRSARNNMASAVALEMIPSTPPNLSSSEPENSSTDATLVSSPVTGSSKRIKEIDGNEAMEELQTQKPDQRLQRIHYLVEQSKLYANFLTQQLPHEPSSSAIQNVKDAQACAIQQFKRPKDLTADLYSYQILGVQWMITLFQNGLNGILADEMGLGKTLQVIAFLAYLLENKIDGPFLIVVPLSTIGNWDKEISKFAPSIRRTLYYGTPSSRASVRRKYLTRRTMKVPLMVTSYEILMADARYLREIEWKYIIVDEGHRLKNIDCKLMRELKRFSSANRMLLTGTPLQNNLTELWALLNFLLPDVFTDLDIFHSWFESGKSEIDSENESSLVTSLHSILRPFLLRRLKSDVDLELPNKREYVVFTGLERPQTKLYEAILAGNAKEFVVERILGERGHSRKLLQKYRAAEKERPRKRIRVDYQEDDSDEKESEEDEFGGTDNGEAEDVEKSEVSITGTMVRQAELELRNKRFSNMMMQLRQACNSPYMFYFPWKQDQEVDGRIVTSSGKMRFLDELMKQLHAGGHRVLIFSQFTKMLDLLADWADLRKYRYIRIDGSTCQEDRQELLTEFDEGSSVDIFLLSTRAGGQGINLTAADTVVLFDSDWNPHQDLQAMDRVHRIGQTKPVLVFRIIAGDTVEQTLLERAAAKLELGNLVIERGKFRGIGLGEGTQKEQVERISQQLELHKIRFDETKRVTRRQFTEMLDRSPEAYERSRKHPKLSDNIYSR